MTGRRGTILIVEDTSTCATTLEIALAQIADFDVAVVNSAESARDAVSGGEVRAIVTDLNLPHGSGLELIRWIRSSMPSPRLPIIVVSGDTSPDAPATSLMAGANAYFGKPFSPSELRRKLEDLIHA